MSVLVRSGLLHFDLILVKITLSVNPPLVPAIFCHIRQNTNLVNVVKHMFDYPRLKLRVWSTLTPCLHVIDCLIKIGHAIHNLYSLR